MQHMTNLDSCFPSVTDDILNVPGTSTDPDGIFTNDLNDPNSARFKQLQEDFCTKVNFEIVDLFINVVISRQLLCKLSRTPDFGVNAYLSQHPPNTCFFSSFFFLI